MTKELVLPFMSLLVIAIVLLLAILICVTINLAMTRRKNWEIMEMLRALNNKLHAAQAGSLTAVSPAAAHTAAFEYAPLNRSTVRNLGNAALKNQADTVRPQPEFTEREIELINVPDKTAAMLMAIVADELKAPINELRFISIKEIA